MTAWPATMSDAAVALRAGEVSSVELTTEALARAERLDARLGTYLTRCDEAALQAAARADADLAAGRDRGPLQGIPIAVKDIVSTETCPTTAQSLVLPEGWGDGTDAPVVARLRQAGAVITGKTTTMEFAIGLPDPDSPFPTPRNPWDLSAWAGGSSSGTANGVCAGLFYAGVGTDTGGSIRMPSALCGVTGLKPTWGRVPATGVIPLAPSLDHVGPIARSARDCAHFLSVIAEEGDEPVTRRHDYAGDLTGSLEGVRVGVERAHHVEASAVDPSAAARFEEAVEVLRSAGAEIVEVTMELWDVVNEATVITTFSEALAWHRPKLRERWGDYGRFTRAMVATGAFYSSCDYVQAQRALRAGRREVLQILENVDVIAGLTVGCGAPPIEGLDFLVALTMPVFTAVWDGLGFPALSVPIGFTGAGLPVGMQLSAAPWCEGRVLSVGDAFQQQTTWHLLTPDLDEAVPKA